MSSYQNNSSIAVFSMHDTIAAMKNPRIRCINTTTLPGIASYITIVLLVHKPFGLIKSGHPFFKKQWPVKISGAL